VMPGSVKHERIRQPLSIPVERSVHEHRKKGTRTKDARRQTPEARRQTREVKRGAWCVVRSEPGRRQIKKADPEASPSSVSYRLLFLICGAQS
jgi:hypothetical protein